MEWRDLFREEGAETLARVAACWEFVAGFPLPREFPDWPRCPQCEGDDIQGRSWRFWRKTGAGHQFRCDVYLKCRTCSACLEPFGVVLTEEQFRAAVPAGDAVIFEWREVRDRLGPSDG